MKKMIPVYVLLLVLIGSVIFCTRRLTQHLAVIEEEFIATRKAKAAGGLSQTQSVYVVNEPDSMRIDGTVDVRIENEPVSVNVHNTPDVRISP